MAEKVILKDLNSVEILPITRGELVLDSSGKEALHSNEFLATESIPGLMSAEDKKRVDNLENIGPGANNKVAQVNTTTSDVYRLLFSETATDETKTEGARKSAKLTFNPSTGVLQTTALIGNLDGTYVNKLTGYIKATTVAEITSEDSLSTALGKLELKADTTYGLVKGAYDGDGTIENLVEILKVLEGISDTETIQAIVGKYLPLSGGTLKAEGSDILVINRLNSTSPTTIVYKKDNNLLGRMGFNTDGVPVAQVNGTYRTLIHSGNIGDQSVSHATTTNRFKVLLEATSGDLNTALAAGGIARNYNGGLSQYTNAPEGASYGIVLELRGSTASSLAGQLAWDVNHASTTDVTRNLWWRASDSPNGFKYGKWHQIAFTDSNVASATKASQDSDGNQINLTYLKKSEVANQELNNNLTTITKSLTVTADWMDTGISSTSIPTTGTYIVQVSVHNSTDGIWYGYWSGVMSWYASSTNDTDTDEIILHRAGHAYENTIYLRTVMQSNSVLKL